MIGILINLIFALPLLVLALNFGIALLLRLGVKSTFLEKKYVAEPLRVSVLLPCFNEGEQVFRTIESILASDYPMNKLEVIAVDDCSADDTFLWIEQAARQWSNVRAFKNSINSGKHQTLSKAFEHSIGEVLICIDSDCIFDKRAIAELMACFWDERIGAVGGRVGVSNVRTNILTQCQTLIYYYQYQVSKMLQNWARNITCISGAMFAIRREHFKSIEIDVKARNWFGIGIRDGEDRYMTHLLLLKGLKTYINTDAQCWTNVPDNIKQLFMQQLRWRRGSLRDFFWTLRTFRANLNVLHPIVLVNMLISGLLVILWPWMDIYVMAAGWQIEEFFLKILLYISIYICVGLIFNFYVHRHNPEQKVSVLVVGAIGLWFIANTFLITLLALCTFDVGDWGTRGVTAKAGKSTAP